MEKLDEEADDLEEYKSYRKDKNTTWLAIGVCFAIALLPAYAVWSSPADKNESNELIKTGIYIVTGLSCLGLGILAFITYTTNLTAWRVAAYAKGLCVT